MMQTLIQQNYSGERALFMARDLEIRDSIFEDGESPLKESSDIKLFNCMFKWKYPLWYSRNIEVKNSTWLQMGRAGVWYTDDISVSDSMIEAPKNFRRCNRLALSNVSFSNAAETLWNCKNVTIEGAVVNNGDYFGMNSEDLVIDNLTLYGNYAFDGCKNVRISNSRLLTKDAFWNTENVTVTDSFISGEYLGWNSKNLTLINCTIESLQGMCYIDKLIMKDCKLFNTTLSFEYSDVDADITSKIDSVFNPSSGRIKAPAIGELIIEKDKIDPSKTEMICDSVDKHSARPEWIPE